MGDKRVGFIFTILLLSLMSACGPATPTPPASGGSCVQFGCPYPAVCDQSSGQCVISNSNTQPPVAVVPPPAAAGQISNNPGGVISVLPSPIPEPTAPIAKAPGGPGAIAPNPGNAGSVAQPAACNPTAPSVSNLSTFCDAQTAGVGGATLVIANASKMSMTNSAVTCALLPSQNQDFNLSCSGPQNSSFQIISCGSCGAGTQPLSNFVCAAGYYEDSTGHCSVQSGTQGYYPCPTGSHYDNTQQACLDDNTSFVNPQCPGGFDHYLPDQHACLQNPTAQVFNCQAFTIPLGACQLLKPACKAPVGGCGMGTNGLPKTWNAATCSCQ